MMITNVLKKGELLRTVGLGTWFHGSECVPSLPFSSRRKILPCGLFSPGRSKTHFWHHRRTGCSSAFPDCRQMLGQMGGYDFRCGRCLGQHCIKSVSVQRGLPVTWHTWQGQAALKKPVALDVPWPFLGVQLWPVAAQSHSQDGLLVCASLCEAVAEDCLCVVWRAAELLWRSPLQAAGTWEETKS